MAQSKTHKCLYCERSLASKQSLLRHSTICLKIKQVNEHKQVSLEVNEKNSKIFINMI